MKSFEEVPKKEPKKNPATIFVHPKADPREPREYSQSELKKEKDKPSLCIIL